VTGARRTVVWTGLDAYRCEVAHVAMRGDRLFAEGTQIGVEPLAYELHYELETGPRFVTRRLWVEARAGAASRWLDLRREEDGGWGVSGGRESWPGSGPVGYGPLVGFDEALDCDVALSPLTNAMPILRHGLHRAGKSLDFVMAWVSVPDLEVHRSQQRYEPVRPGVVRYVDRDSDFVADLELDGDGLVGRYPGLAERVPPVPHEPAGR
jgi:hypothetical protein